MKYLSVFDTDEEVLTALRDIYLRNDEPYDLDCTFSKGVFYKNIQKPKYKSDLIPLYDDVVKSDCRKLEFIDDNSLNSIVFDPPFLFRNRKSENKDKISDRFSCFTSYDELISMYSDSLDCFYRKLKNRGFVFFKCQDMTDGKFYCTHNAIINYATNNGFELKDILIKKASLNCKRTQNNKIALQKFTVTGWF